jgi:hypothetical protein
VTQRSRRATTFERAEGGAGTDRDATAEHPNIADVADAASTAARAIGTRPGEVRGAGSITLDTSG